MLYFGQIVGFFKNRIMHFLMSKVLSSEFVKFDKAKIIQIVY